MTSSGSEQVGRGRVAGESALVLLLVLGYLWLFRTYGFDVVDEGTQLAQIDRVARGARPYLDFETGYTPWYFLLETSLWRLTGAELLATRTFGVVLHATTIALLFAFVRLWFGPLLAVCIAAFDLAFLLPVSPRLGAPFNTPYPGWLSAPLALAAQLAIATVVHARVPTAADARCAGGRRLWAVLAAGLAAGIAFSVKPNAGLFVLAGALLALVPSWPAAARGARSLGRLVRGAVFVATILLLGRVALEPAYAIALLLPVLLAVRRAAPLGERPEVRPLGDGALLAAGFLAPVVLWALPLLRELGPARFAREVLLLDGGGVVGAYLLPLALPGEAALVVCLGVVVAAVLARRVRDVDPSAPSSARWLAPATLGFGVGLAAALGGDAPLRITAEEVCLWLGPVALVVGLALLPREPALARVHALLAFAVVYSLQLFPRPDLIHVAMGAPPLLLAIGATWWWLGEPFARQPVHRRGPPLAWVATGLFLVLCVARACPALRVRLGEPMVALDAGRRAPLVIAASHADEHRWLGEAVRAIGSRSNAGAAVFYFPDLAGLGFLAARPSPFFYLYFVPGRPDRAGEQRTIAELERLAPQLAVTGTPRVAAFAGASAFFTELDAYLEQHYDRALPLSACTVRERTDAR